MHYILIVKGKLNNMNDYIRALNTNRYKGADMKKDNESRVMQAIYEQFGRLRITRKVRMHYRWYEPDKRRDLDNVSMPSVLAHAIKSELERRKLSWRRDKKRIICCIDRQIGKRNRNERKQGKDSIKAPGKDGRNHMQKYQPIYRIYGE